MRHNVKDLGLADRGERKIELAEATMPVLRSLREAHEQTRPLDGLKVAGCVHVTKETAVLIKTLKAAGADVAWAGCNPLSTQDDIAAALVKHHAIPTFAWRGQTTQEYYDCILRLMAHQPRITIDDGADLVTHVHSSGSERDLERIIGGTEETTTGVNRLRQMHKAGTLRYPIIAVNDARTKCDFDNIYGTGQSAFDGIIRSTNALVAGKTCVVAGYGHCGSGVARRAQGLGANVIITEIDPLNALRAKMDGYQVMPMARAAAQGDIFITTTGCRDVIRAQHFRKMKDGAILANVGHFDLEVVVSELETMADGKKEMRPNNLRYTIDGKRLYLIAEGRLANLAAAEGHPSEVMDMSFANQFLSVLRIAQGGLKKAGVYGVPEAQDAKIARIKLKSMGVRIDSLSAAQKRYLNGYDAGT